MFDKVAERISVLCGTDKDSITAETCFADLRLDSIDIVEVMMDLEDEYGIILEPDTPWVTVGDLVKFLEETVKKNGLSV